MTEHPDARHEREVMEYATGQTDASPYGDVPERKPTPQVGDHVTIGYEHPDYPGVGGTVTTVKPSRAYPEVNMVRVAIDAVWVTEDELR